MRRYSSAVPSCSAGNCGKSGKHTSLSTGTPCSQVSGLSRCIRTATLVIEEIRRQSSVSFLSGPAIVITNVATASVFLVKGWSTESVSRVVRTARTTQEKHEKERAEHAYYSHIHDEAYDAFPATIQKLDEDENLPEDTAAQDDQEDETEQSLSETLQTRRQISKIHENMGHPSNRTLVQVLPLGGTKRRFILAAARHKCVAC